MVEFGWSGTTVRWRKSADCSNVAYPGITAYRCHVFHTISNAYIQAVLSVLLTFVPHQHVLKLNKNGNVNESSPINIHCLIDGLENKLFL